MDSSQLYHAMLDSTTTNFEHSSYYGEYSVPFTCSTMSEPSYEDAFGVATHESYDIFLDPLGDADWTHMLEYYHSSSPSFVMSDTYSYYPEVPDNAQSPMSESTATGSPYTTYYTSPNDVQPEYNTSPNYQYPLHSQDTWSVPPMFPGCEHPPPPVIGAADAHSLPVFKLDPVPDVAVNIASPVFTSTSAYPIEFGQQPQLYESVHVEQPEPEKPLLDGKKQRAPRRATKARSMVDGHADDPSADEKTAKRARRRKQQLLPKIDCDTPKFKCEVCGTGFTKRNNLTDHNKAVHLNEREFVCEFQDCRKPFARKHDLKRHHQSKHTNLGSPRRKLYPGTETKGESSSTVCKDEGSYAACRPEDA